MIRAILLANFEHDEKATQEAQKDADALMDTHMK
jgi:hypothetical protein